MWRPQDNEERIGFNKEDRGGGQKGLVSSKVTEAKQQKADDIFQLKKKKLFQHHSWGREATWEL